MKTLINMSSKPGRSLRKLIAAFTALAACVLTVGSQIGATAAAAESAAPAVADLVVKGAIYTVNPSKPWADAVAIRDGHYVFVGSVDGLKPFIGPKTRVVDLAGKMAMPGINDTHVHPLMGAIKVLYECNFPFTATAAEISRAVAGCAAKLPAGKWIKGGQYGSDFFVKNKLPSPKGFLDAVAGGRPVYLYDDSGHNGWANSKALELAKIDAKTPDPAGGTIVRNADGSPTGELRETAARLFDTVIPELTDEENIKAAAESVRIMNAYGITGMKDAGAFTPSPKAFSALDKTGGLSMHVATCLRTPYGHHDGPLDYAALEAERKAYKSTHVNTDFVKIFLDGVPTAARTAAMIHPYTPGEGHGGDFSGGDLHVAQALLSKDVAELDKRGFTVKMHAAGDRSVRAALNAIEQARKVNGASGLHHEIAHAGYVDPVDLPRFASLDAVPDFSPYIWFPSPIMQSVIGAVGEPRASHYWPTRSLLDSGAYVAAGSDWPAAVPDANPWVGIQALVTRANPFGATPGTLWKEQAVTLDEALKIFTLNGARALKAESVTGSVEVGKSADLIVLDHNLFKSPIQNVSKTQVQMTLFEGKVVYERKN